MCFLYAPPTVALSPNSRTVCPSIPPTAEDQVSHPYKTTGKPSVKAPRRLPAEAHPRTPPPLAVTCDGVCCRSRRGGGGRAPGPQRRRHLGTVLRLAGHIWGSQRPKRGPVHTLPHIAGICDDTLPPSPPILLHVSMFTRQLFGLHKTSVYFVSLTAGPSRRSYPTWWRTLRSMRGREFSSATTISFWGAILYHGTNFVFVPLKTHTQFVSQPPPPPPHSRYLFSPFDIHSVYTRKFRFKTELNFGLGIFI
jgi:hypothetical protein